MHDEVLVTDKAFAQDIPLKSAYPTDDATPTFVWSATSQYRIDHMLATPGLQVAGLLEIMAAEDRDSILERGIPNARHPSDHLPIGASFRVSSQ